MFSLFRNPTALRFTSFLGFSSFIFFVVLIMVEYFLLCARRGTCFWDQQPQFEKIRWEHLYRPNFEGLFICLPLILYSTACHPTAVAISQDIERPTRRRIRKVMKGAVVLTTLFYTLVGTFGFLLFLDDTKQNILLNNFEHSYAIIVLQFAFGFALTFAMPLNISVIRITLRLNDLIWWKHALFTFGICACAYVLASDVQNITTAFGFVGASTLPMLAFMFPPIILWKFAPRMKVRIRVGLMIE